MEQQVGKRVWEWRYWFGVVDNRPVAIFRIALGLVLLKDAIYHLFIADILYSNEGIFPPATPLTLWPPADFTLYHLHDSLAWVYFLMLLWVGVTLALVLGWQTRWAAILNWLLLLSVQERTPLALNGADIVLSVMSFWMLFLPLGEHYSLDSRRRPAPKLYSYALPVRLAQLQVALIYLQTAILKYPGGAWFDGYAVYSALHMTAVTSPLTDWFVGLAPIWLLTGISWATWGLEASYIVWVYFPWGQPYIRLLALVPGYLLHLGIASIMAVPNFSVAMMSSYFLWWDGEWVAAPLRWLQWRWPGINWSGPPASREVASLSQGQRLRRWFGSAVLLYVLFCVFWILARGVLGQNVPAVTGVARTVIRGAGLAQRWTMFSFGVELGRDAWVLVVGEYEDEQLWDMQRDLPLPGPRQRWLWGPMARFKKYEYNILDFPEYAQPWAEYFCREGARTGPDSRLLAVEVQSWRRSINRYGDPAGVYQTPTMEVLYRATCH